MSRSLGSTEGVEAAAATAEIPWLRWMFLRGVWCLVGVWGGDDRDYGRNKEHVRGE